MSLVIVTSKSEYKGSETSDTGTCLFIGAKVSNVYISIRALAHAIGVQCDHFWIFSRWAELFASRTGVTRSDWHIFCNLLSQRGEVLHRVLAHHKWTSTHGIRSRQWLLKLVCTLAWFWVWYKMCLTTMGIVHARWYRANVIIPSKTANIFAARGGTASSSRTPYAIKHSGYTKQTMTSETGVFLVVWVRFWNSSHLCYDVNLHWLQEASLTQ